MKEIIELLATLDELQKPYIHRVKTRLSELLNLDEKENELMRIEQSTSRSWEEGATTDLRIGPIKSKKRIEEIRAVLITLSGAKAVKYEEGHNLENNAVEFIVTGCDVEQLEGFTPPNQEEMQNTIPVMTFIRMSVAGNREYVRGISFNSEKLDGENYLGSFKEGELNTSTQEWFSVLELLDLLNSESELNLIQIQNDLKSLLGVKFEVYFHSSSEEFPIDLRTGSLDLNEAGAQQLLRAMDSLVLLGCLKTESKELEDGQKVCVIKQVNPQELHKFSLKKEKNTNANSEMLSNIIELLKQSFPNNQVIRDLVVFDGREGRSMSRPYLHIRTQVYHQEATSDYKSAMIILKKLQDKTSKKISFDFRNEMVEMKDESRPVYMSSIENTIKSSQFIIDVAVGLTTQQLPELQDICAEINQSRLKHRHRHNLFKPQIEEQKINEQNQSLFLG
ncbi:TPA: Dot/Icm T4SS effector MavG [Legionella pneumophila]|uniref:Uncharacterized protein n=2 Tax=Legionella pneumophila TaxID=446 RepID=Q5ZSU2_LEGPH|nr:Dot/Icm T4SS effector MavG [Legionella pneumophila]AAU28485.1 hypothetical protein lpg2424 [Legionella pneumophila subsp. pneumophila str. Philadelphia 1]AEW52660.1 hypothetical protein lp12_2416 [Legionella pneumophila subsp. pneumophila ATCC 43290]AGH52732.1 hypothetical protein LPE509_00641 [Legionella pneumophila subsp. pneumophila LPE509]AGN15342.1 hypothetical protein LP6_2452 [Legionella pneumophila subsp. pneumophila str. Thunder Bay]AOU05419.1 hypothetical protein A9E97_12180 [Legi